ncbi:MAG: serine/threonine-protein kinase [Henriciella sp.]|uniref:serine/threonine-protein kinase n=1 Tax=Henriciella sp. TaxID=1968823 RepID=UPI0032EE7243
MKDPDTIERQAMALMAEVLEVPEAEQDAWLRARCGSDRLLFDRVKALLDADSGQTMLRTGGAGEDSRETAAPERAGAYRIVDLIGQGGMGAVYLGERDQDDFDHRVAIKVIRPGALRDSLVERFSRERQILASLNHPNIARLFDGGYLDDGSPFIVMEHVDGEPVLDYADACDLDEDGRIALFADICAAISYAHQNLVVHRDITPTNVLVTRDGVVKVIDFGIAKPHEISPARPGDNDEARRIASMSYTPGYAAPERLEGAPANTLSDVYSLGKLLADLLPDYRSNTDLAAIVSKATAREPEARYSSVDALADDLDSYRKGLPVEARQGGAGYRFGRFFARHRLTVSLGSLAVLVLAGTLVLTLIQYNRAETALTSANARFNEARELSRALIFEVYDSFDDVAGTLEPRQELAALVRDYVNDLALDETAPEDLLFEVGTMQLRLSDLYGGIGMANFGELETSAALLEDAEASLELALEKDPDNAAVLAELIMVKRVQTMQALNYASDPNLAQARNAETTALAKRGLALEAAEERPFLRHLWSARTDLLQILLRENRLEEAEAHLANWRTQLTPEMYDRLGGGEEMGAYMAFQQGQTLNELGRHDEAADVLAEAIAYRDAQLEAAPQNYYQLTQLMVAVAELSAAYRDGGDGEASLEAADRAVDLARRIRDADPEDAGGPEGLSRMLLGKARAEVLTGRTEAALVSMAESLDLVRGLVDEFPDDVFYQKILLEALLLDADLRLAGEASASGCERLEEARMLFERLDMDAGHDADMAELEADHETLSSLEVCAT